MKVKKFIFVFRSLFILFLLVAFLDLFFTNKAFADTFQISGTVTDSSNNPISDIQVGNPYTGFVTTTDQNGYYTMSVPNEDTTIEFWNTSATSSMKNNWFLTMPITISGDTEYNIQIPSSNVTVTFLDPSGNPLPGATMYVSVDQSTIPIQTSQGIVTAQLASSLGGGGAMINGINTNDQGTASGTILYGTQYALRGDAPGYEYLSFEYPISPTDDLSETFEFNTPPAISGLINTTLGSNNVYNVNGTSLSHNVTTQTATVDYGDGSGVQKLNLTENGNTPLGFGLDDFTLNHIYISAGVYTVTVSVSDVGGETSRSSATITVNNSLYTTITPIADSYLNVDEKNQNEGGSPVLRLNNQSNFRTLVKFDESQIAAAVGGDPNYTATLQFTITSNGNNWGTIGGQIELDRLFQDWAEGNGYINGNPSPNRGTGSGVTWKCAADSNISNNTKDCTTANTWDMDDPGSYPFSSSPSATTIITNHKTGTISLDVTSDVQSFLNGTNQNHGWILKKADETVSGKINIGSKESGNSPVLIITPQ